MARAYLGIGGNLGRRRDNMRAAVRRIQHRFPVLAVSSLYETEPVGYEDQPSFLNAVLAVDSPEDPRDLHRIILEIEADLGRQRTFTNAPRTIDIDILLFGDQVLETENLTIPHPRMHERAFVMIPLAEIGPNQIHPGQNRSVSDIAGGLGDVSDAVKAVDGPGWVDFESDDVSG